MELNNLEKQAKQGKEGEIRYLSPIEIYEKPRHKYCLFKKYGLKHVDYKNPNFLLKFLNPQGQILPRRITGTSVKYQGKVSKAIKRARHLAILPFITDDLK
ncbi:30S ribosomal protein S18 [Candidatus Walczuchella endosymbiont of Icerya purchasi]|uniref:30S ribosomal protein S18 n=1 Tax=Candidatus Walczuchella endosymbiont of Icerya purchasi TaxID=3066219 RepID=UPI00313E82E4